MVITGADTRRGRGKATSPNPVKEAALELGLRVEHEVEALLESDAQLGIVVAYGAILRSPLLDHMPFVNLHFSLLPRWRGAAPVERAILSGDVETGVCVMAIEEGLDTGGIYASATTPVDDKTLFELWEELSDLGGELLVQWLPQAFAHGELLAPTPQRGEATYAAKLAAEDRRVDLDAPAAEQFARVRLGNAWTMVGDKRLKLIEASLDRSVPDVRIEYLRVQPEGKRPMLFSDWWRGATDEQRAAFAQGPPT
ncbi:MAG: methionyl-tRNA formyltransferase [Actinobacteria bacterium]|nr:methionyl-tRNA formyltransferase [Actinomycetota bacterium]